MKIDIKKKNKVLPEFYRLPIGAKFIHQGHIWVKISRKDYDNSIRLFDGLVSYFDEQAEFQTYKIEEIVLLEE